MASILVFVMLWIMLHMRHVWIKIRNNKKKKKKLIWKNECYRKSLIKNQILPLKNATFVQSRWCLHHITFIRLLFFFSVLLRIQSASGVIAPAFQMCDFCWEIAFKLIALKANIEKCEFENSEIIWYAEVGMSYRVYDNYDWMNSISHFPKCKSQFTWQSNEI